MIRKLKGYTFKENQIIYTTLSHTSRSGMMRHIKVIIVDKGKAVDISYIVSELLDWKWVGNGAVKVSGCGMDMGFHLVYTFSRVLFKGKKTDAGYCLKHQWL